MILTSVTFNNCDVIWETPSDDIHLSDAVEVWRVQIAPNLQFLDSLESLLQPDELKMSSRFHQLRDKQRFIIRRAILRSLLSRYLSLPAREIEFISDENKKPFVKQTATINLNYNVSHSGDWILIAVGKSGLGVDIEQTDTVFAYNDVLNQSFSLQEISYIQQSQNPKKVFFQLWTRKEALTKATSKGLDDDLVTIPCLDGEHQVDVRLLGSADDWLISSFEIIENYMGSIACPPGQLLRFFDFEYTL